MRIVNRRASHDFQLLGKFEAGMVLTGPEVKSIKAKRMSLTESFIRLKDGEAWLFNAQVNPYPFADNRNYDPKRTRKLLLQKDELRKLEQQTRQKKLTIVPVSCYTRGRNIKLEIALAKGKKKYQKREAKKRKDLEREVERELKT